MDTTLLITSLNHWISTLRETEKEIEMATRTITHYITPEDSPLGGTSLEIIATIGKDPSIKKIPISLTICYEKEKPEVDDQGNLISKVQPSTLQYYHYSIPNKLQSRKSDEPVIGIPLLDTNNGMPITIKVKIKKQNLP